MILMCWCPYQASLGVLEQQMVSKLVLPVVKLLLVENGSWSTSLEDPAGFSNRVETIITGAAVSAMWNVGTVARVCEIRACNNSVVLLFGRACCCGNSHAVTSCQSKVFFYRGNINSFLFLSCTPNILSENFPGRGGMPCIATLPERKVDGSPDDTGIHSAFKNDPPCIHLHPFAIFFHMSFSIPPQHDTESHPRGHMQLNASYDLTENWIQRTQKASFLFIICSELWDWCHKDSFCAHSPFILSLKGVEHSQWSCVGERSREFPSPFSQIRCTRTHTHTHGAFLWTMMHSWSKCTPTDIHIKDPCVQKHMRSFPLEQNIFLS